MTQLFTFDMNQSTGRITFELNANLNQKQRSILKVLTGKIHIYYRKITLAINIKQLR